MAKAYVQTMNGFPVLSAAPFIEETTVKVVRGSTVKFPMQVFVNPQMAEAIEKTKQLQLKPHIKNP